MSFVYREDDGIAVLKGCSMNFDCIQPELPNVVKIILNGLDDRSYDMSITHMTIDKIFDQRAKDIATVALSVLINNGILLWTFPRNDAPTTANTKEYLMNHTHTELGDMVYLNKERLDQLLGPRAASKRRDLTPPKFQVAGPLGSGIGQEFPDMCSKVAYESCAAVESDLDCPYLKLVIPDSAPLNAVEITGLLLKLTKISEEYDIPIASGIQMRRVD